MSGIFSGVINQGSTFGIQTATVRPNPIDGLAYQLYFDAGGEYISVGDGKVWRDVKGSSNTYTFGNGLTLTGRNVTNNLTTGKSAGNIIFGFDDDLSGVGLELWSATTSGINSNFIRFGSWDGNNTAFFSNTGAWNFGAETDPTITTPYQYVFQSRGVFNAQWDFNAAIKLLNTTGSHIQSVWQTSAPTGNANQTHLFFDSVGSPSFRIGTNNWFKFTPNTLTANRNYILRDTNYTLAGTDIDNSFSVAQTFIAGSAATTSINFGTTGTGIYGDAASVRTSVNGNQRLLIDANGGILGTSGQGLSVNISSTTPMISMTTGNPINANARCLDIICNPSGSAQTGSYTAGVISNLSNQTGTSSHRSLYVSNFETGRTASGNIFLLDLGTNSNSNGQVSTHSSKFNVSNSGKITSSATAINFASQTPASATAIGTTGDIAWDTNYIYVCVNTNTWKRSSITTW